MLITILGSSCEKAINLGQFDPQIWKVDFNGCDGSRTSQMQHLAKVKKEFYGISESQLLKILGKPNREELGERGKRTYLYFIAPGKQCLMNESGKAFFLAIDIDALNRVSVFSLKAE